MKQLASAVLLLLAAVILAAATVLKVLVLQISPDSDWEPAVPRDTDPAAPMMDPERCARLPGGHDPITRIREDGTAVQSCPRCGADPRELHDFDDFDVRR